MPVPPNEPRENAWDVLRPDVIRLWNNARRRATELAADGQRLVERLEKRQRRAERPSPPWSRRDVVVIAIVSVIAIVLMVFNLCYGGGTYLLMLTLPPVLLTGALFTKVQWPREFGLCLGAVAAIGFGALVSSNDVPALLQYSLEPQGDTTLQEIMRNEPVEFVRFLRTVLGIDDKHQLAAILLTAAALYVLASLHALAWGLKDVLTARAVKILDYPYLLLAGYGLIHEALPLLIHEPGESTRANLLGLYAVALALAIRITKASIEVFRWYRRESLPR